MNNSDPDAAGPITYYDRYSTFSDSQIKEILKNHKNYQETAVTAAVKIAIERGLINSEQDLLAPEYQYQPTFGFSVFPRITNDYQYKKVVASIFRVLFFLSFLPIIFGAIKYAEGQLNMTYVGVGLGLIWLILSFLLLKTKNVMILVSQIILLILVFFGVGYRLFIQETFNVLDLLMLIVGTLLPIYFLLYLKTLNQTKPE
jgi:hypothetical protein